MTRQRSSALANDPVFHPTNLATRADTNHAQPGSAVDKLLHPSAIGDEIGTGLVRQKHAPTTTIAAHFRTPNHCGYPLSSNSRRRTKALTWHQTFMSESAMIESSVGVR
jgi:hypothetical protein